MPRRIKWTLSVLAIGTTCIAGSLFSCGDDSTNDTHGSGGGAGAGGAGGLGGSGAGGLGGSGAGGGQKDASTEASNDGGATEGGLDGSVDAGPGIPALCHAIVSSGCAGTGTFEACTAMLAPLATCAKLMTCTTCAGAAPQIACLDGGGINVSGCESACERLSSSCTGGGDGGMSSDSGMDGANSEGGTPSDSGDDPNSCLGAPIMAQTDSNNTSLNPQAVPFTASGVAIFGQSIGNGTFGEIGGFFDLSGLLDDTDVNVQIVTSPCATTNCPTDITFAFEGADGGNVAVSSTSGACGSAVVRTSAGGHLFMSVGKSGDAGAENGVGIVLKPVISDGGADAGD